MKSVAHLVEQHVLEFDSHLRHIDALMERARSKVETERVPPEVATRLAQLRIERDQVALQFDEFRHQSAVGAPGTVAQAERAKGVLETIRLELETAITAIFDQ